MSYKDPKPNKMTFIALKSFVEDGRVRYATTRTHNQQKSISLCMVDEFDMPLDIITIKMIMPLNLAVDQG